MIDDLNRKQNRNTILTFTVLFFITILLMAIAITTGVDGFFIEDLLCWENVDTGCKKLFIIREIRFPRALFALVAGAGLGISGAMLQNALRNSVASPFTLGVSHAAAFGANFGIVVLKAYEKNGIFQDKIVFFCAFASAITAICAISAFSALKGVRPHSLILAGVGIGALFHALTAFIQFFAKDSELSAAIFWSFGDLSRAGWGDIFFVLPFVVFSWVFFQWQAWHYNVMRFGDDDCHNLGINASKKRFSIMIVASLIASVVTVSAGVIGFVGLVAPHLVRMILGDDYRVLISASACCGGILLLGSDILARTLMSPINLPVGILTAFVGVPVLICLLDRKGMTHGA